jgi:hypothetical protein
MELSCREIQQTAKKYLTSTRKKLCVMADVTRRSLVKTYLRNLMYFPLQVDSYFHYCRHGDIHRINPRHTHYLHIQNPNLAGYQKCTYYAQIKLSNTIPASIKSLNHNTKLFKPALKDYLLFYSFYSVEFT